MASWQIYGATGWEENWPLILWTYTGTRTTTSTSVIYWENSGGPTTSPTVAYTLPADTLGSNDALFVWISFDYSTATNNSIIVEASDDSGSNWYDLYTMTTLNQNGECRMAALINQNSQTSQVVSYAVDQVYGVGDYDSTTVTRSYDLGSNNLDIRISSQIGSAGTTAFNGKIIHYREPV